MVESILHSGFRSFSLLASFEVYVTLVRNQYCCNYSYINLAIVEGGIFCSSVFFISNALSFYRLSIQLMRVHMYLTIKV